MSTHRAKYGAKKVKTSEGAFDSKKEYRRFLELKQLEAEGTIKHLERQKKYELIPSQRIKGKVVERACTYKADFVYEFMGETIVEDVKGMRTPEYIIKRKLMLYLLDIKVTEV